MITPEQINGFVWPGQCNPDATINGFILATDLLTDVTNTGGMANGQPYFHQVVANQTITVGGMAFKVNRSGSVYQAQVALHSTAGTLLAIGDAGAGMGSGGWKKAMFTASYRIEAGKRYVLSIGCWGDNIPGFAAANGHGDYNQYVVGYPWRNFRKAVGTLNANIDFTTGVYSNADPRPYLSLVVS